MLRLRQARQHGLLELSARPSLLAAAASGAKSAAPRLSRDSLEAGQVVAGSAPSSMSKKCSFPKALDSGARCIVPWSCGIVKTETGIFKQIRIKRLRLNALPSFYEAVHVSTMQECVFNLQSDIQWKCITYVLMPCPALMRLFNQHNAGVRIQSAGGWRRWRRARCGWR